MSMSKKLVEWQQANLLTAQQVDAIRHYEDNQPGATAFLWRYGLLGLGLLTIAIGLVAIVASNWNGIPAALKLGVHVTLNLGIAGLMYHWWQQGRAAEWRFEAILIVKSVLVLTLMALIGQIMHTQSLLEDTLLLWWGLITPMLVWLGRYRITYLLWTILTITVTCMNISYDYQSLYLFGVLIGMVQLYTLLPLFATWRINKPSWAEWGRKNALAISIVAVNMMLIFPFGYLHDVMYDTTAYRYLHARTAQSSTFQLYGWEIALVCNAVMTILIMAFRFKTVSPVTLFAKSDMAVRIVSANLLVILILCVLPEWFGWFMLYWLAVGYTGLRHDNRRVVSLAITALAARIIIVYFELTQSLMTTGILMILSGIGVLYMVKTYPRWRTAILSVTKGVR